MQAARAVRDPYSEEREPAPVDLAALAAAILPTPDPLASAAEQARASHADLAAMDDGALWRESERARLRLVLDPAPPEWARERARCVQVERARRRELAVRTARGRV